MSKNVPSDFIVLSLSGKDLIPEKITELLGVEPHSSACKGGALKSLEFPDHCSGDKKSKTGFWTSGMQSDMEVTKQFTTFTKSFRKIEQRLREVMSWEMIEDGYIELVVHPPVDYGVLGVKMEAKDVEFWSSIGFDICCSVWNPKCYWMIEDE